jgi:hypothetical protein
VTKDEAIIRARSERARTGFPQAIEKHPDGSWSHRTINGRKFAGTDEDWWMQQDALAELEGRNGL